MGEDRLTTPPGDGYIEYADPAEGQERFNESFAPRPGSDQELEAPLDLDDLPGDVREEYEWDQYTEELEAAAEAGDVDAAVELAELEAEDAEDWDDAAEDQYHEEFEAAWDSLYDRYPGLQDQAGELSPFGERVEQAVDEWALAVQIDSEGQYAAVELRDDPEFVETVIREVFDGSPEAQQSLGGETEPGPANGLFGHLWEKGQRNVIPWEK